MARNSSFCFMLFRHLSRREIRVQNRLGLTISQFDVFREQPVVKAADGQFTRRWNRGALAR